MIQYLNPYQQYKNVNNRFKTSVCKDFDLTGKCPMDIRCHYAHGKQELRNINDPLPSELTQAQLAESTGDSKSNLKSQTCKYYLQGNCSHNENCKYNHKDQATLQQESLQQKQSQQEMEKLKQEITKYQCQYLLHTFDQVPNKDPEMSKYIKLATYHWEKNELNLCVQALESMVFRQTAKPEEKEQNEKIMIEAKDLAQQFYTSSSKKLQKNWNKSK